MTTEMVRVVGVGDNTVDTYIHLGMMFPGGNAVNVPVLAHRYGHDASYIGCLGNDVRGRLILKALEEEGVDVSHVRVMDGPNAYSEVLLVDGDRVFGDSTDGMCDRLKLNDDDLDFIAMHDVTHTSIYSHIEAQLPTLSEASRRLSFDFSSNWDKAYLEKSLPWVDIAILSCRGHGKKQIKNLMRWAHGLGPEMTLITLGVEGSMAFDGEKIYEQGIVETEVVDTLGAGDAFAARFMTEYLSGAPVQEAMQKGAESAAETCSYYGAFGHGIQIDSKKV